MMWRIEFGCLAKIGVPTIDGRVLLPQAPNAPMWRDLPVPIMSPPTDWSYIVDGYTAPRLVGALRSAWLERDMICGEGSLGLDIGPAEKWVAAVDMDYVEIAGLGEDVAESDPLKIEMVRWRIVGVTLLRAAEHQPVWPECANITITRVDNPRDIGPGAG